MIFPTWEDAERVFQRQEGVMSDDSDAEEDRLMRWMENNGHRVIEDDPLLEMEREEQKNINLNDEE